MTDIPPKPRSSPRRSGLKYAAWIVTVTLLYLLSAGPAEWLVYRWGKGFEPNSPARTLYEIVYAPAEWLASHSPRPIYGLWQRYNNYFFDLAYREEDEKWRRHPSARPLPRNLLSDASGSESNTSETSSGPRIAGRTLSEWQNYLKRLDPQTAGTEEDVAGLIALLQTPDVPWFTRRQAALTIGRMHVHHPDGAATTSAIPALVELLSADKTSADADSQETSPAVWSAQALALFGPAAQEAAPRLIDNLRDADRSLTERLVTIEALAVIGAAHPDVIPALIDFLEHSTIDPSTSTAIKPSKESTDDATNVNSSAGFESLEDARVLREAVVEAFGVMGPGAASAIPTLIRALADPAETMRCKSAVTLGMMEARAEIAVPTLLELLAFDDSTTARDAAGDALGKIGPASLDGLAQLADQPDPELRRRAVAVIGGIGRTARARTDLLLRRLDDEDSSVRIATVEALWKVDPQTRELIPALVKALGDDDRQHRMAAHRVLVTMGPAAGSAIEPLQMLLKDERNDVRRLAEQTIEKLHAAGASSQ